MLLLFSGMWWDGGKTPGVTLRASVIFRTQIELVTQLGCSVGMVTFRTQIELVTQLRRYSVGMVTNTYSNHDIYWIGVMMVVKVVDPNQTVMVVGCCTRTFSGSDPIVGSDLLG